MRNKRGFTLIELLTVIAILAVILLIAVPMMLNNLNKAKQKSYENQVGYFIDGAKKYMVVNENSIIWTNEGDKEKTVITLSDMADEGLFKLPIKNPETNEAFDPDKTKIIVYKEEGNQYTYNFEDELKLVSRKPGLYLTGTSTFAKITLNGSEVDATWENIKKAYPAAFSGTFIVANGYSYFRNLSGDFVISNEITMLTEGSFRSCTKLTNIIIPESVTVIHTYSFRECTSITSIIIPKTVKIIDSGVFLDCRNLINVTIPDGVTKIGNGAFYNCTSLTNIIIPESVTTIDSYAFHNCTSLNVTIPSTVTLIKNNAFDYVSHITYSGSATGSPWGALSVN